MMAKCIKTDDENILKVGEVYNLKRKEGTAYDIQGTGLVVSEDSVSEYFTFPQP